MSILPIHPNLDPSKPSKLTCKLLIMMFTTGCNSASVELGNNIQISTNKNTCDLFCCDYLQWEKHTLTIASLRHKPTVGVDPFPVSTPKQPLSQKKLFQPMHRKKGNTETNNRSNDSFLKIHELQEDVCFFFSGC